MKNNKDNINILLFNTGVKSNKAERVRKIINFMKLDNFGVSYGDGVGNVNINKLYKRHLNNNFIASCASIRTKSQYGHFVFEKNLQRKTDKQIAIDFVEKPMLNLG